jgi:hypothetical protein
MVPEALKIDPEQTVNIFEPCLQAICEKMVLPDEWKKGTLIRLRKKGDVSSCNNWTGIQLLSSPRKIFFRIILYRIKGHIDNELRRQQMGFREGSWCTVQVSTLRIVLEQSKEFQSPLYLIFIDFQKSL